MPEATTAPVSNDEGRVDAANLLFRVAAVMFTLLTIVVLLGAYYREQTLAWSQGFVELLGGPGVFFGLFFVEAFPIPIPLDSFLVFGMVGGLGYWPTVGWGGAGSICGAGLGFFVGRWLATTRVFAFLMKKIGSSAYNVVKRYGAIGLALSTVTPIPFGACCWAVGALGLRFRTVVMVAQLRWLRIIAHVWLIEAGFVGSG